jgi:hypothetical protein
MTMLGTVCRTDASGEMRSWQSKRSLSSCTRRRARNVSCSDGCDGTRMRARSSRTKVSPETDCRCGLGKINELTSRSPRSSSHPPAFAACSRRTEPKQEEYVVAAAPVLRKSLRVTIAMAVMMLTHRVKHRLHRHPYRSTTPLAPPLQTRNSTIGFARLNSDAFLYRGDKIRSMSTRRRPTGSSERNPLLPC